MSTSYGSNGLGSKVVRWLVIGFLAIVALRVGLFVLGAALKVSLTLLFTLGPLVLVGWLVMKLLRRFSDSPSHAAT